MPKAVHGPVINDGWFSRGAAWNANEDIVVYVAEQRAAEQTPAFGGSGSNGSAGSKASGSSSGSNGGSSSSQAAGAAPRTWRGVAAAVEDWGELNTGGSKHGPHHTSSAQLQPDRANRPLCAMSRIARCAEWDLGLEGLLCSSNTHRAQIVMQEPVASAVGLSCYIMSTGLQQQRSVTLRHHLAPASSHVTTAGKQPPSLFALNTTTWQVHEISGLSAVEASWGQPAWTPDGQGLVAVAWPHKALNFPGSARRLGIVHCYNRPCQLYYIPYKAPAPPAADGADGSGSSTAAAAAAGDSSSSSSSVTPVKVSGDVQSALSPVFSPAGDQLAFVSQEAAVSSGVHAATSSLYAVQWGGEVSVCVNRWLASIAQNLGVQA